MVQEIKELNNAALLDLYAKIVRLVTMRIIMIKEVQDEPPWTTSETKTGEYLHYKLRTILLGNNV